MRAARPLAAQASTPGWVAGTVGGVRKAALLLVVLALAAGCSDDGSSSDSTDTGPPTFATLPSTADLTVLPRDEGANLNALAAVLEARLDALGAAQARAVPNQTGVEVEIGRSPLDVEQVANVLSQPGALSLRPVLEVLTFESCAGGAADDLYQVLDATGGDAACLRLGPPSADDVEVDVVTAGPSGTGDEWAVFPTLTDTEAGIGAFNRSAAPCYEYAPTCPLGQLALLVDGQVLIAPPIRVPAYERDQIQISGGYEEPTARRIAGILAAPLPVAVDVVPA